MQGWVSLHRELIEKPIWLESTPEQKTVLITLLLLANHKENEWEFKGEKYKAKPGQFVTSLEKIQLKSGKGISLQNVRTALKRFEKYEFLTNESTNKNRLITIVNWGFYQDVNSETNKQTNKQLTSNQQATNKQLTTNNNDNNKNNDNKKNVSSISDKQKQQEEIKQIRSLYPGTKTKAVAIKKLPAILKQYSVDELKRCIERYIKFVDNERKNGFKDLKYLNEGTFWNGRYLDFTDEEYKEEKKNNKKSKLDVVYSEAETYEQAQLRYKEPIQ
jgi:hypothetical protein